MREKPICFEYQIWSLCSVNGYPYYLQIYKGKKPDTTKNFLGQPVVKHFVDVALLHSAPHYLQLFFGHFFTRYQ